MEFGNKIKNSLLYLNFYIFLVGCFHINPSNHHSLQSSNAFKPFSRRSQSIFKTRRQICGPLYETKLEEIPKEKSDEIYILEEPATGRVIECYLDCFAVIDDKKYAIAYPRDWAVSLATENEDGILDPIDPLDDVMDELYPWLAEYLKKDDVELFRTPITLTLQGEFLEEDEEDDDEDWLDEDEEEMEAEELKEVDPEILKQLDIKSEGDGDIEFEVAEDLKPSHQVEEFEDEVDLIATFWYKDKEYSLLKLLDPVLMVAKHKSGNRFVLLDEDEAEDVNPKIEYLMESSILDGI